MADTDNPLSTLFADFEAAQTAIALWPRLRAIGAVVAKMRFVDVVERIAAAPQIVTDAVAAVEQALGITHDTADPHAPVARVPAPPAV